MVTQSFIVNMQSQLCSCILSSVGSGSAALEAACRTQRAAWRGASTPRGCVARVSGWRRHRAPLHAAEGAFAHSTSCAHRTKLKPPEVYTGNHPAIVHLLAKSFGQRSFQRKPKYGRCAYF